jgi:hypothetical protein
MVYTMLIENKKYLYIFIKSETERNKLNKNA